MYCLTNGLHEPSGYCDPGYYCSGGARDKIQPNDGPNGGICPAGTYCLEGSHVPVQCPVGTFMPNIGNTGDYTYQNKTYFCQLCPTGKACVSQGISSNASALSTCDAGYFCNIGSSSTRPICSEDSCQSMYGICPEGHYCPAGIALPVKCQDGYFMNTTGASACTVCPRGYYCDPTHSPVSYRDCPQGYYCPVGTGKNVFPCPIGRFGKTPNLNRVEDCEMCDQGYYCSQAGLPSPEDLCQVENYK